jgi:hypothetical protein
MTESGVGSGESTLVLTSLSLSLSFIALPSLSIIDYFALKRQEHWLEILVAVSRISR